MLGRARQNYNLKDFLGEGQRMQLFFHQLGSLMTVLSAHSSIKWTAAWDGTAFESLEILLLEYLVHFLTCVEEVTQPSHVS